MPPRAPRRTEGPLPQSSAQAGSASGPQGCIAAPPLCGDTTRLPLQRGCIVAASALAGIHHGCLRTPTYCIICSPLFFKQSGDASRVPPRMGGCIVDASAVQGTAFLTNKTKASSLAQALSTLVATRARSIEASDCDLRPFPDPSAPLGIEWWLRSQRASAPPRANAKAPLALQHELEKAHIMCSPFKSGDASRVPPRMWGCIVGASASQRSAFV